jgi:hypothetical protein
MERIIKETIDELDTVLAVDVIKKYNYCRYVPKNTIILGI